MDRPESRLDRHWPVESSEQHVLMILPREAENHATIPKCPDRHNPVICDMLVGHPGTDFGSDIE